MEKYISVGSVGVSTKALNELSDDEKKDIITAMFGDDSPGNLHAAVLALGCDIEKDDEGQILLYTGMKYNSSGEVVSLDTDEEIEVDEAEIESYEEEEQEEEDELPITLRTPGADQNVMRHDAE